LIRNLIELKKIPGFAADAAARNDEDGPRSLRVVMRGHSRSKNGVALLAYDPRIHAFSSRQQDVDSRAIRAFTPVFDGGYARP
jgi:hypothetical protein